MKLRDKYIHQFLNNDKSTDNINCTQIKFNLIFSFTV